MTHISAVLENTLHAFRPASDTEMTKIWEIWNQAVGEAISLNAKPGAFRDGVLIVHVSSSVWMHQLRFQKQEIITRVNLLSGKPLVKELRFKIAALHT